MGKTWTEEDAWEPESYLRFRLSWPGAARPTVELSTWKRAVQEARRIAEENNVHVMIEDLEARTWQKVTPTGAIINGGQRDGR